MLRDSAVVVAAVVRTRPRAIPLTMITMRKSTHGFPFVSYIWVAYGALNGGPSPELRHKKLVPVLSRLQWAIYSIDFYKFIYFSIFSLVLFLIEKIYQTLKAAFHYMSKHNKVRQEYSAMRRIFN